MGTWGVRIFEDDTACDVREEYRKLLTERGDAAAATDALIERWQSTVADTDEGPVFWLALAVTQHKLGRLEDRVAKEAMRVLDHGLGLDRWRDDAKALKKRIASLEKVRAALAAPPPPPKRIKPPFRDACAWQVGELIAYRLKSAKWIVLRVLGHETHAAGVGPVCEVLEWMGAAVPAAHELDGRDVRRCRLATWPLFQILARNAPEYASEPQLAMKKLMAEMGLIDASFANVSMSSIVSGKAPPGIDWARHHREMEKAIDRLRAGDGEATDRLHRIARERKPVLLDPVSQISLRREVGFESLPMRRLKRLKAKSAASPPHEWLAIRWFELDEALDDVYGLR